LAVRKMSSRMRVCRAKASQRSRCKSGPRRSRSTLVATREAARATDPSKPWGQRSALGGSANVRAATRVKPEQAPKAWMRAPSLLSLDEGRWGQSDRPTLEDCPARRGSGRSTYARGDWQHGRPVARPGGPGTDPAGGRAQQASEGPIVPRKLGNASGGKGPWFGVRSDEPRGGGLA
jgi:hypothetical protein